MAETRICPGCGHDYGQQSHLDSCGVCRETVERARALPGGTLAAAPPAAPLEHDEECASCGEGCPAGECPESKRPCGHHCNHSWSHDYCCWCGTEFDEEGCWPADPLEPPPLPVEVVEAALALWSDFDETADNARDGISGGLLVRLLGAVDEWQRAVAALRARKDVAPPSPGEGREPGGGDGE